jgi:hypothetical protein
VFYLLLGKSVEELELFIIVGEVHPNRADAVARFNCHRLGLPNYISANSRKITVDMRLDTY